VKITARNAGLRADAGRSSRLWRSVKLSGSKGERGASQGYAGEWKELETRIGEALKIRKRPVAVGFLNTAPINVQKFVGTEPSGCSFWRLPAEGRVFYTAPENHTNCAVGAYTHNISLSPEREKETGQTLKMMFDLGYVKPEEVPQIPRLSKAPRRSCMRRSVTRRLHRTWCCWPLNLQVQ